MKKAIALLVFVIIGPIFGSWIVREAAVDTYAELVEETAVAYYKLSEGAGSLADAMGGTALTVSGSPIYGQPGLIPSDAGTSIAFSSGSYASVGEDLGISGYPFSFEFITETTSGARDVIVFLGDDAVERTYSAAYIENGNNAFSASIRNSSLIHTNSTTAGNDGSAHHVVCNYNSATDREVFVDGVSRGTQTDSVAFPVPNRFAIAALRSSSPGDYYSGTVQHVSVHDVALSQSQISERFAATGL